ncbi:uncharacterized protein LOC135820916 [Sycon ciliatum]|uniref:uncharacterized protein LOC135820916 n=1 Tax=Sycon ciliatum TaxID=27933 RepID=UPI0031F65B82
MTKLSQLHLSAVAAAALAVLFLAKVALCTASDSDAGSAALGNDQTNQAAAQASIPEYVKLLYNRVQDGAGYRYASMASPHAARFRFASSNADGDDDEVMFSRNNDVTDPIDVPSTDDQEIWQPFQREESQLNEGASAVFFTGTVTSLRSSDVVPTGDGRSAETLWGDGGGHQALDVFDFKLRNQRSNRNGPVDFQSAYLDFWWQGLNVTDDALVGNLLLQFELDLQRGSRRLQTLIKSFPLSNLPRGNWLSVDMTTALQVWQAFISDSETTATVTTTGETAALNELAFSAFIVSRYAEDDDDDAEESEQRSSPLDLHAMLVDEDRQPVLTLIRNNGADDEEQLELSEAGIEYLHRQELEHSAERRRRSSDSDDADLSWAPGQSWLPKRRRSCQLFQYSVPSDKFRNNIIQPQMIPLNICHGMCKVPFHDYLNASTHATLAAVWKQKSRMSRTQRASQSEDTAGPELQGDERPKPQTECVAVGFKPLHLLTVHYHEESTSTSLETLADLEAAACGCR